MFLERASEKWFLWCDFGGNLLGLSKRGRGYAMARGRVTFKQRDLTRALRATRAAGIHVHRIEIETSGKIVVVPGERKAEMQDMRTDEWANI